MSSYCSARCRGQLRRWARNPKLRDIRTGSCCIISLFINVDMYYTYLRVVSRCYCTVSFTSATVFKAQWLRSTFKNVSRSVPFRCAPSGCLCAWVRVLCERPRTVYQPTRSFSAGLVKRVMLNLCWCHIRIAGLAIQLWAQHFWPVCPLLGFFCLFLRPGLDKPAFLKFAYEKLRWFPLQAIRSKLMLFVWSIYGSVLCCR